MHNKRANAQYTHLNFKCRRTTTIILCIFYNPATKCLHVHPGEALHLALISRKIKNQITPMSMMYDFLHERGIAIDKVNYTLLPPGNPTILMSLDETTEKAFVQHGSSKSKAMEFMIRVRRLTSDESEEREESYLSCLILCTHLKTLPN